MISGSNRMSLHPCFEQGELPQPRVSLRAHLSFRGLQHVFNKFAAVKAAGSGLAGVENISDIAKERSAQIPQRRHRKIALGTIEHLCRQEFSSGLLQNVLAAPADLELCGNTRRELHHLMIEE